MGVVVTPARTLIDDCNSSPPDTRWSSGDFNDAFNLEGAGCLGEKISQTTGVENMFTFTTNVNMSPGGQIGAAEKFFVIPMSVTGKADTKANGGYRIVVIDGNADKGTWYVGGDDTTLEKWTYFVLLPSTAPTLLNGAANVDLGITSITRVGTLATATTGTPHGLATGDYVVIDGAVQNDYNGSWAITVTSTTTFDYTMKADPGSSATGTITCFQGVDFTDVDQVGVQGKVTSKAVGNTPNFFWDICWYGDGLQVTSTTDSVTITRSGTVATVSSTAHGLLVGDTVRIAGITDKTEDNGDHVIVTVPGANSYTYTTTDSGSTSYTGTITARVHATWQHIADADAAGFWGLCVVSNGQNVLQGRFALGSISAADDLLFVDSNFICTFRDNEFLPPSANNILLYRFATTDDVDIELSDGYIGANNTSYGFSATAPGTIESPKTVVIDGVTFSDFNSLDCGDQSTFTWNNIKFVNYDAVINNAATMNNIQLKNALPGSLGMFVTNTTHGTNNLSDFTFTNGGDYHISFLADLTPEQTFDNFQFDDTAVDVLLFAGISGAQAISAGNLTRTGSTAQVTFTAHGLATNDWVEILGANETEYNGIFKITVTGANTFEYTVTGTPASPATGAPTWEEALIINQINGSNGSTSFEVGGVVDFKSSLPISITVREKGTGTPIQDAHVQIYLTTDYSTVVMSQATNASGIASTTYGGAAPVGIEGWARQVDVIGTDYEPITFIGTIAAGTGFALILELEATS